jgi:hypothetical protein
MKIPPKIKKFADGFGVEYRVGKNPEAVNISGLKIPASIQGAYVGEGVIFVRKNTRIKNKHDFAIMLLHELSHAILDFYEMKIPAKQEELKANAMALGFAAYLRLPVSNKMVRNFERYAKIKALNTDFK